MLPVLPVFPVFPVFPAFPVCVQDTTHGRWCMRLSSPHPPPPNPPSPTGREFSSCSSHCARAGVLFHLWPWKKTEQNTERNDEERHVPVRPSSVTAAPGCTCGTWPPRSPTPHVRAPPPPPTPPNCSPREEKRTASRKQNATMPRRSTCRSYASSWAWGRVSCPPASP